MPRISRLNRSEVGPSSVAIYDRTLRDRGNVPNMFRTMAHRPAIFETIIAHMEAVLNTPSLVDRLFQVLKPETTANSTQPARKKLAKLRAK